MVSSRIFGCRATSTCSSISRSMRSRRAADTWVEVDDRMQRDYAYQLTEPAGRNFHADFRPELTPKEMLALGVFGGKYMTDCRDEYPEDWFEEARLCPERH